MRNRPEETMPMIAICAPSLAIAVGLMFALETVPAARAQVTIDVSKITCDQYTGNKVTNRQNIAIWLSGYYHGKRGETTVDTQQLGRYAKQVRDYCLFHPETLVMQALRVNMSRHVTAMACPLYLQQRTVRYSLDGVTG